MTHTRHIHPKIEICRICTGTGTDYEYHKHDRLNQHPKAITCKTCEGSGRVLVSKKTEITVEPFKTK